MESWKVGFAWPVKGSGKKKRRNWAIYFVSVFLCCLNSFFVTCSLRSPVFKCCWESVAKCQLDSWAVGWCSRPSHCSHWVSLHTSRVRWCSSSPWFVLRTQSWTWISRTATTMLSFNVGSIFTEPTLTRTGIQPFVGPFEQLLLDQNVGGCWPSFLGNYLANSGYN